MILALDVSGLHVQTAEFGVQSYRNGERGKYMRQGLVKAETDLNVVTWRPV